MVKPSTQDEQQRRIQQMQASARSSGKACPSDAEMEAMWPDDMTCPECGVRMVTSAKESWHDVITLQHHKNGDMALMCMRCNAKHGRGPARNPKVGPYTRGVTLPSELWERLDELASRNLRSRTRQIQFMLESEAAREDTRREREKELNDAQP